MPGQTPTTDTNEESLDDARCYCRLDGVIELLSRKYAIQLICGIGILEPARYGEIEAAFEDVSSSTLSARLEELTDAGLLEREQYAEIPPRVEYRLTEDGAELRELLDPLLEWAESRGAAGGEVASGNRR
jgi:DNA-binding HxlR family transcriptional regulator